MLQQGTDLWDGQTDPGIRVEPAKKNIISVPWPQGAAWLSRRGPELRTGGSAGGSQVLGHSGYGAYQGYNHLLIPPHIIKQAQLSSLCDGRETGVWRHAAQKPYLPSLLSAALCQAVTHKADAPASLGFHFQSLSDSVYRDALCSWPQRESEE